MYVCTYMYIDVHMQNMTRQAQIKRRIAHHTHNQSYTYTYVGVCRCIYMHIQHAKTSYNFSFCAQMRGEFHFWGWNSILRLNPSLFQVSYSLCMEDGTSAWKNARTGEVVDLTHAEIKVCARVCIYIYVYVHMYI